MDFIKKVWQLTTLRVSPEEVPYHRFYLFVAIGLNFLLGYLVTLFLPVTESALHLSSAMAIVMKAVNIFFLAFFLYLILYFSKKTNRFFKLFLSIVVGILLIEIVNFLVSMIVPFLAKYIFNIEFSTHAGFALLFNLMVYGTIAWMIIFLGHIFRFGLDASRFKGIWIGIGYILLSGMFSMIILGNPFKELV